ncbi:lipase member I-like [Stegodyphus dumicola]|uniref:lipase member I-like n=1 Tax=Stegodyphus dumicola TaxID=202533 RepID=UPI0015B24B9B|nr:lipase member I-like [Stegodyphus dumicola]
MLRDLLENKSEKGLDPAGPGFRYKTRDRRLDKTDARLVDVIHTNGADDILKGFGIKQPIGHINFYPEGGEVQAGCQPSLKVLNNFKNEMKDIWYKNLFQAMSKIITKRIKEEVTKLIQDLSCSHSRSTQLFIASIRLCKFESVTCESWEHFSNCKNVSSKLMMGFYANKNITASETDEKFYLKTDESYPYCK